MSNGTGRLKGKHSGRRGRKRRKQAQKVARKERVDKQWADEEMQKRLVLVSKIRPVVTEICSRSSDGVAVPYHAKDLSMEVLNNFYCPEGWVRGGLVGVNDVSFNDADVIPWIEFTSYALKQLRKRRLRPFREKNILQIIADQLGPR